MTQEHRKGYGSDLPEPAPDLAVDRDSLEGDIRRVPKSNRAVLADLITVLDVIEELSELARDLELGNESAGLDFDALLLDQMDCIEIPDKPGEFGFASFASGQPNNPPTLISPQLPWRPPCLLPPSLFGHTTNGILRRVLPLDSPNHAIGADQSLWRGLWTIFHLVEQLRPLEWLFNAGRRLDAGHITIERFRRISGAAIGMCGAPRMRAMKSVSGLPIPIPDLAPRLFFPCRLDQWNETERAIRCFCIETYHIDRVANCSPGREGADFACIGDCIEIAGRGFGNDRRWDRSGRMSEVLFPTASGTPVAATAFLPIPADGDDPEVPSGWSDTRVRVQVPPTAVPGDIELQILCRKTNAGRSVDPARCRYPTRLRTRTSESFLRAIGPLRILFSATTADGEFVEAGEGGTAGVLAEACTVVQIQIEVTNADSVGLEDETGADIALTDIDPSTARFRASFSSNESESKTFTLTAENPCLESPVARTIEVVREHRVQVVPVDTMLVAGSMSSLHVHVSCPLESDGVVAVSTDRRFHGVTLPEGTDIPIPAGSTRSADVPLATSPVLCGAGVLTGNLTSGSAHPHRTGTAVVDVTAIDVPTTLTARARGNIQPGLFEQTTFSSPVIGPFPATFSADRTRVTLNLPSTITIDPISLRPRPAMVVASYNGTFSNIDFALSGQIGGPFPFEGGTISMNLSSTADLRPEFGRTAPVGSSVTRATDAAGTTTFNTIVVGAGTVAGGTADGRRIGLGVTLMFAIRPPRNCNLEPWFSP